MLNGNVTMNTPMPTTVPAKASGLMINPSMNICSAVGLYWGVVCPSVCSWSARVMRVDESNKAIVKISNKGRCLIISLLIRNGMIISNS